MLTVSTVDAFGPTTILTGDNRSVPFFILPGQFDINVNTDRASTVTRNAVTTNTFLTTQFFEIDGTSGPVSAVPEPGSWALLLIGAAGMILLGWNKWDKLKSMSHTAIPSTSRHAHRRTP